MRQPASGVLFPGVGVGADENGKLAMQSAFREQVRSVCRFQCVNLSVRQNPASTAKQQPSQAHFCNLQSCHGNTYTSTSIVHNMYCLQGSGINPHHAFNTRLQHFILCEYEDGMLHATILALMRGPGLAIC